ncbi:TPA: protein-tyrosine phosphatase family protein [Providencia rettgeri]
MSHIKNSTVPIPQNTPSIRSRIVNTIISIRDRITGIFSRQIVSIQQDGTLAPRYAFNSKTVDLNSVAKLKTPTSSLPRSTLVNNKVQVSLPKLINTKSVKDIDDFHDLKKFTELQNFQYCDQQEVKYARFSDIKTAKETQICITNSHGIQVGLPANRVRVGDNNLFIRSQSPINATESIENHLQMLYENRTPMLCVLASGGDIKQRNLPAYFRTSGTYGRMIAGVKECQGSDKPDKFGNLNAKHYSMRLNNGKKVIDIPVVHIENWTDQTTTGTVELIELAKYIEAGVEKKRTFYESSASQAIYDESKLLPVIHCAAGIGRTGQVATAMQLIKPENKLCVSEIIMELRKTGCDKMVQNKEQFNKLLELETLLNIRKPA